MSQKQLSVRLNGKPVGVLEQLSSGELRFAYDQSAQQILSLSMPLREEAYIGAQCEAFFGGLLPESDTVKRFIGKRYGISHTNIFSLLKAIGHDCAGAVSFHAMNEPYDERVAFELVGRQLDTEELYQHIRDLPKEPLFSGFSELRLSLAGVQDKAAICMKGDKIILPTNGCPTTHILKPAVVNFAGIIDNECFCLRLARRMGLSIPTVFIQQIKDISVLIIERYDRYMQGDRIARIHQEDFCQALGVVSSKKYQNEGGPSFKDCFNLLNNTTRPAFNRNSLVQVLIFNFFIGNMDAHAKNFSLLHQSADEIGLTPFYDLICTAIYPNLPKKMAMKIGNQYKMDMIFARHWQQLADDIGYSYPALKKYIVQQGVELLAAARIEREHFIWVERDVKVIDEIIDYLDRNVNETLTRLESID